MSKRVPVRLRHKIEKASAAKQRKQKRLAKKDPTWRTKLKKDPGIPNLFPYKEKLIQEIEEKRRIRSEEMAKQRADARTRQMQTEQSDDMVDDPEVKSDDEAEADFEAEGEYDIPMTDESNPMAALLALAQARASKYEGVKDDGMEEEGAEDEQGGWSELRDKDSAGVNSSAVKKDTSRKAFDKLFKDVVDAADVVLYVLDARDPEGTRSQQVERSIMTAKDGQKRLILVLNKIDLVPSHVLKGWLSHLRRYFPTLPLLASSPAANAKAFQHKQLTIQGTSETLLKSLKSYAQSKQLKRAISVGVIGYPNVGKSSVINALSSRLGGRGGACPIGAEAGVTTSLREVKLDSKLKLIDCPGIVFPSISAASSTVSQQDQKAHLVLLNAIPPKEIDDPVSAVKLLLRRLSSSPVLLEKLYSLYDLPELMMSNDEAHLTDFLVQVARKRGRLGKGGIPNVYSAAQAVLTDWRDGRIQGWQDPPQPLASHSRQIMEAAPEGDEKIIVKQWAVEFKLDGLWGDDEPVESATS